MSQSDLQCRLSLDALNFFLADVRDGLGPYLAIYLLTVEKWDAASIGIVMSVAGVATILAQTPAGALIDRSRAKRGILAAAAIAITLAAVALPFAPSFWSVASLQAVSGAAGAIFPPAVAAVTLGIVGPKAFPRRVGRNEAFNHAGNAVAAAIAAGAAWFAGPIAVFWLMAAMTALSLAATPFVPGDRIDHDMARGLEEGSGQVEHQPSGISVLVTCPPLLVFALSTTLFHFANAAMLPLVGQKLALQDRNLGTTLMASCIVAAQLVMVPVAVLVGRFADRVGRKPIFLTGLAVLTLRGLLYPVSDNPFWLVGVQLLDGVGAGIFGALFPLVVADLMRGTGRFNIAQGAIATAQGIGAALSTTVAGFIVTRASYSAAFVFLACVSAFGLAVAKLFLPETRRAADVRARTVPSGALKAAE
ncbi:MFS transporter [Enterovirga sp. CN4-39]|uniref:MFS transporter n=1 Tax=Enterovirga sp. CN4-39 TaxID=3400910 RepID=UPI003C0211B0